MLVSVFIADNVIMCMVVLQELSKSAHSTHPELIQTVTAAMHIAAHSLGVNVGGKPKL